MPDNFEATNVDAVDSSKKPMSEGEFEDQRTQEKRLLREELEKKHAENVARFKAAQEAKAIADAQRDIEEREKMEALKRIRASKLSTEAGQIQSREVMDLSEERMLEARNYIRVEGGKHFGVLSEGNVQYGEDATAPNRLSGQMFPESQRSGIKGSFETTPESEDMIDNAEPMAMGISLKDLQNQFAMQDAIDAKQKKAEAKPEPPKPPVSERAKRAMAKENPFASATDEDIDDVLGNFNEMPKKEN